MKLLCTSGLLMLITHFKCSLATDPKQIELIDASVMRVHEGFVNPDTLKYELIKADDGQNKLHVNIDVIKRWANTVKYFTYIFLSKSKDGPWEYETHFTSYICQRNYNKQYLPANVILMINNETGPCVKKGNYETYDGGIYKYYKRLSENDVKGHYVKIENEFRTPGAEMLATEIITKHPDA